MDEITKAFVEKQRKNFKESILNLYCTSIYSSIDSACALPAEFDNVVYELEQIYNSMYLQKTLANKSKG